MYFEIRKIKSKAKYIYCQCVHDYVNDLTFIHGFNTKVLLRPYDQSLFDLPRLVNRLKIIHHFDHTRKRVQAMDRVKNKDRLLPVYPPSLVGIFFSSKFLY